MSFARTILGRGGRGADGLVSYDEPSGRVEFQRGEGTPARRRRPRCKRTSFNQRVIASLLFAFLFLFHSSPALAQIYGAPIIRGDFSGRRLSAISAANGSNKTSLEGASLQTVSDQELFKLRRAKEFADDQDFRSAIALWQSVLDAAGSQLMTRDQWRFQSNRNEYSKYVTVANEIENILAHLSAEGLAAYRLKADGAARAALANPGDQTRMHVLSEVVRRYFLSAEGDEAAFELACLKMDRYEFTGASRLLRKCLEEHPDCTVPRAEILLRLAVANARIGDKESVDDLVTELKAALGSDDRTAYVAADVLEHRSANMIAASSNWPQKYGSSDRTGTMLALPAEVARGELSEAWTHEFDLYESPMVTNANNIMIYGGGFGSFGGGIVSSGLVVYPDGRVMGNGSVPPTTSKHKFDRKLMTGQWKRNGWKPVGSLLLHEGMIYFKRDNRVMCCAAETGEMEWMGRENEFQHNPMNPFVFMQQMGGNTDTTKPTKPTEVQLFGDQVYQAMSIGDGILYSVEGPTSLDPKVAPTPPQMQHGMTMTSRSRRNWLTAYDAVNGKLRWRRTARDESIEDSKFEIGFSSAPVTGGGLAFTTVNDNGSVWLMALQPEDGVTVWKTFLCDEPAGGCAPWGTTGIAYAGGDVYVGTGAGIAASVDGVSGALRWIIRYERTGNAIQGMNPYGMPMQAGNVSGWREDVVVPTGRALVVMGSDSEDIFAIDQRTGELLWDSPKGSDPEGVDYYLGMRGDRMYVGGKNVVRCYDAGGGRILWATPVEDSLGAGIVTEDAVYVPSGSSVVRLSLEDGTELSRASLITITREPVGNLYSDGNRLLAVGMARVYAMTLLQDRIDQLDARVAANDVDALLERMRLRSFQGKQTEALDDLLNVYELTTASEPAEGAGDLTKSPTALACETVVDACTELNLASTEPEFVLRMVDRMARDLTAGIDDSTVRQTLLDRLEGVLFPALTAIHLEAKQGLTEEILAIVPLCEDAHMLAKVSDVIQTTSSHSDVETFRNALSHNSSATRMVAVTGLIHVLGKDAFDPQIRAMMRDDPSDRLRMRIAFGLANEGERESLTVLGALLESKDPNVRRAVATALGSMTGQRFESVMPFNKNSAKAIQDWQDWIAENGESAELELPYTEVPTLLGRTLVCYMQKNRVVEYDEKGKQTWQTSLPTPFGVQGLSNGHRLVASFTGKFIVEYDETGAEVWRQEISAGHPTRVYRIDNGNTLVSTQDPGQVLELRDDGSIAWRYAATNNVMDARRLENGNTLVTVQDGQLIEVDPAGNIESSRTGLQVPVTAQPLANGNVLIGLSGQNTVIESDKDGKTVWSQAGFNGIMDAQRLPNGNTLVADVSGVREYTPTGKEVAAHVPKQSSGNSRRTRLRIGGYGRVVGDPENMINRVFRY